MWWGWGGGMVSRKKDDLQVLNMIVYLGEEDVPPGTEEPLSIPPPDLQTIIDKMASYVARDGDFKI